MDSCLKFPIALVHGITRRCSSRDKSYAYTRLTSNQNATRNWSKFSLLMWKNWMIQKRHPVQTAVEVLAPILLSVILVLIRILVNAESHDTPTTFHPFSPENVNGTVIPIMSSATKYGAFIGYSPSSPVLEEIMNKTALKLGLTAVPAPTSEILLNILTTEYGFMKLTLAGVVFDDSLVGATKLPNKIKVELRFPAASRMFTGISATTLSGVLNWKTHLLFEIFQAAGPRDKNMDNGGNMPGYYPEGFLALQHALSSAITENITNRTLPKIQLQRFPYPAYVDDPLLPVLQRFASVIVMLSFVYTCVNIVKAITVEKEYQLKESMKIMGLPCWLHWTAWFLKNFLYLSFSVVLMALLMKIRWKADSPLSVLTNTSLTLLLVFLLLYATVTICFCFMISVFFTKASIAAAVAGLSWFLSYSPYLFLQQNYGEVSFVSKILTSLFSNTAMGFGFQLILMHEGSGNGLQWNTILEPAYSDDTLVFGHIMIVLAVDGIIYLLIALYVEAIFPGDFGIPQPWYFPFQLSYWKGISDDDKKYGDNIVKTCMRDDSDNEIYEQEFKNQSAGIKIINLSKVYKHKIAVNNLKLNMYEGDITVLLGHNGAGKTSTMSMLSGMIRPSSGTAIVGGYDIKREIHKVRSSLGLCPQHNVLFDDLTVAEHFYFFSKLKGMDDDEIENDIKKYLKLLDLKLKSNALAKTLSGGMKRKLSVGIALCGNSKIVMLDEPTTGMDPAARRSLWNLLKSEKKERTILLITHFMDEADVLGDKIAIMAGGELQCCGSSFFLKKKYGAGYRLVVVKGPRCKADLVTQFLQHYIPNLCIHQNIATELTYLLEEDNCPLFENMFKNLEEKKDILNIHSFGISLTTMEEVFMRVGKDLNLNSNEKSNEYIQNVNGLRQNFPEKCVVDVSNIWLLTGCQLYFNQTQAMIMKHVFNTLRSWFSSLIQVMIPVIFLIITYMVVCQMQGSKNLPDLPLVLKSYGTTYTPTALLMNTTETRDFYLKYQKSIDQGLIDLNKMNRTRDMEKFVLKEAEENLSYFRKQYITGCTIDSINNMTVLTGWFNNEALHAPAIALNMLHNTVLKHYTHNDNYSIMISNHPLPFTQESKAEFQMSANNLGFEIALNISFSMAFTTAFYVMFYINEQTNKSKLLQFVSGVKSLTYWATAYVWDLIVFFLISISVVITMAAFHENGYKTSDDLGRILFVMMCYGWATLPLIYLSSYFFVAPTTGYTKLVLINIVIGVAGFLVVSILKMPVLQLQDVAGAVDRILIFFPLYCLATCFKNMYTNSILLEACEPLVSKCSFFKNPCCKVASECLDGVCIKVVDNYFDWTYPGVGINVLILFIDGLIFLVILFLAELRYFEKIVYYLKSHTPSTEAIKYSNEEDEIYDSDIAVEKEHIQRSDLRTLKQNNILLLIDLSKYYGNVMAVNKLCIGVKSGECFGLLGVNGAGKTTTFKMLTGDEKISSGEAYVNGLSLKMNMKQVHQIIGYCPQFDALIDNLTGRETLKMFCLLRGIPKYVINFVIDRFIDEFALYNHIDKLVKDYSGGNKRKLSTAVALIGDPKVIYLDEPTAGMDPAAKRHLWNVICKVRDSGKCIILTSHSMEECEALCTKISIMVNGKFQCLGSPQHLKTKFAEGYTLLIKTKPDRSQESTCMDSVNVSSVKEFVAHHFPGSVLREQRDRLLTFYIPHPSISWSRIFGIMENVKDRLNIEDYSLGQTSLEQVFLNFTKHQRECD